MSDLNVGDIVLSVDTNGKLVFSPIILDLDTLPNTTDTFLRVRTSTEQSITLTPNHLIYSKQPNEEEEMNPLYDYTATEISARNDDSVNVSFERFSTIYASQLKKGDLVLVYDGKQYIKPGKVVDVEVLHVTGLYSPLTTQGNIIVDDVVASCYADFDNHALQHLVWAPFRWWQKISELFPGMNIGLQKQGYSKEKKLGMHWYAQFLTSLADTILPWKMLDPETYRKQEITPNIHGHLIFHTSEL